MKSGSGLLLSTVYMNIGSVGSGRCRSLAGRLIRFVTDKTLLLSESGMASTQRTEGGLISAVFDAIRCLPVSKQAAILLDTSLALIEAGQCGVLRLCFLEL